MTISDEPIQFVIQEHRVGECRHWDLMFEDGEGLATWSLRDSPDGRDSIRAVRLDSHRRVYLTYEGPISGERGSVQIWDRGCCRAGWTAEGIVDLELEGARLTGQFRLRVTGEREEGRAVWNFSRYGAP